MLIRLTDGFLHSRQVPYQGSLARVGTSYTCSAINEVGDASGTVLIKKDSVAPVIQFKKPVNNVTYAQNQTVTAAYGCTDVTSGVASCTGSVAGGAAIPTTTVGQHTFSSITITDATANAPVYYTLNGSVPTTSSSVYSGAISVSVSETLKAIAEAPVFSRSAVRSATYTIQ